MFTHTFLRILPLMWHRRFTPSMHCASRRPFPSMRSTCAYSADGRIRRVRSRFKVGSRLADVRLSLYCGEAAAAAATWWRPWCCIASQFDPRTTACVSLVPCPSSLKMSSLFSSPSFFPRRLFFPPFPLFFGIVGVGVSSSSSSSSSPARLRSLCLLLFLLLWH